MAKKQWRGELWPRKRGTPTRCGMRRALLRARTPALLLCSQVNALQNACVANVEFAVGKGRKAPGIAANLEARQFRVLFRVGLQQQQRAVLGQHEQVFANNDCRGIVAPPLAEAR